jgi:hypothetical protein
LPHETEKPARTGLACRSVCRTDHPGQRRILESPTKREAAEARDKARVKAEAMFQERCKKAGEFIHRTEEEVEGIFLLELRPDDINGRDRYRMDGPYGRDLGGLFRSVRLYPVS